MITVFVYLNILNVVLGNFTSFDLRICKLTHAGTEYVGKLSRTEVNSTCQYWNAATQKGSELIVDEAFPDGSKSAAKNYCRNPNRNPKGPWCYTTQKKLIFDTCNVPLCKSSECRMSGPGMEYSGPIDKSSSGKKCTKWESNHKLAKKNKQGFLKNRFFPDGSVGGAGRKCRNPDGDIAGPWCYVETQDSDLQVKELCDIPFCDDLSTIMYSQGSFSGQYFFFSSINETQSFQISFRLWDPSDWVRGQVYIYLSAYDTAVVREEIERWNSGIELVLSQAGSGLLSKEEEAPSNTPLILTGANWTNIEINWTNVDNQSLIIQVFEKSKLKAITLGEVLIPGTVFEIANFRYFSVAGSPTFWKIPSSDDGCPVHTVTQMNFTRFWLVKKTLLGKDLEFFVRGRKEAVLVLRPAPMNVSSQVQVIIGEKDKVKIFSFDDESQPRLLSESSWPKILTFWKWEYFKLSIIKDKLQIFWVRQRNTELLIQATHSNMEKVMWVTIGSPTASYWTIDCDPRGVADPPPAVPPECISNEAELFNGSLSVTRRGRQCIPWTDKASLPEKYQNDELFSVFGGRTSCQNFCRNLDKDPNGPYCMVRDLNEDTGYAVDYCEPRLCSLEDCKISGTGSDYVGQLNVTRSKRQCRKWIEVDDELININNFPDPSLNDAKNFCRNPSKSMAGVWCFTSDERVKRDLCYIRDCDKPLECTVLTSGYVEGIIMYILPSWRKNGLHFWLKAWNPDIYEGLIISLKSIDYSREYKLLIGDENNEKVKLFHINKTAETLLVEKTLLHLIPTGKWGGYWLRMGTGKIELGYHDMRHSFFEWTSSNEELSFKPMFMGVGTIRKYWIGINYQCGECLVEQSSTKIVNKIYPLHLWREELKTENLTINLRGTGNAIITLMWTEDFNKSLSVEIMSKAPVILIVKHTRRNSVALASFSVSASMSNNKWSEYTLSFSEKTLTVHKDGESIVEWQSPFPLILYWFGVSASEGTVTWTANCPPADIDGGFRDGNWGKWGPWSCSASCGRGEGKTERACDNPPPSVFGDDCKGSSFYEGPCNDFPCGQISPATHDRIRQYLSTNYKALEVHASEKIVLPCNSAAISLIRAEVSDVNITWTHNGFPYSKKKFYMNENYSLVIQKAQEKHNGIYFCVVYQDPAYIPPKIVIEVISLAVLKPKPTKKIRKGRSMILKCNGLALSYVYGDLSQRWELNGTIWKDYGLGTLQTFTVDKLENITDSHAGIWTCVVIQEDLRFKWTTNWILLEVKSAPSFWSHLMEDVATAPIFGKLGNERNVMVLFFFLIASSLVIIISITVLLLKLLKT